MTICNEAFGGKDAILRCGRLLRSVEGRRQVYDGFCDGRPAIIKIFLSALHGKRHFKRELDGFKALAERGIATAGILAHGRNNQGQYILVLEKIENAGDVFTLLTQSNNANRLTPALEAVFATIAAMHAAGIVQRDLHLGNFLWDGSTVYVLDPAEMEFTDAALDKTGSFRQLAVLFSSLPEMFWNEKESLLKSYFQTRQWDLQDGDLKTIESLTDQNRSRNVRRMLRKTLRTTRRYLKVKRDTRCGVFVREVFEKQDIEAFLRDLDNIMEGGQILKRGNTSFVSKIRLGQRDIVVKRYNHKGLWHSFRHTLKRSRARRSWLFGHRLEAFGIAAARPVAFIEECRGGLVRQSYILNEFLDGPDIRKYLNRPETGEQDKNAVSAKTAHMLETLSRYHMAHCDLKPNNILIVQDSPWLIDLDSMKTPRTRFFRQLYSRRMEKDITDRKILWNR